MKQRISGGGFVPHTRDLIESAAMQVLSSDGLKVLQRIELEHLRHGGRDNGRLVVPYGDFIAYGIRHPRTISRGLKEAEALGLIEIRRGRGGRGNAHPNLYRLTYLPAGNRGPTDEWRQFATLAEARAQLNGMHR
jgi:hypothetical protein